MRNNFESPTLLIIRCLVNSAVPLYSAVIAQRTDLPRMTVHRVIATLIRRKLIHRADPIPPSKYTRYHITAEQHRLFVSKSTINPMCGNNAQAKIDFLLVVQKLPFGSNPILQQIINDYKFQNVNINE